MNATNTFLIDLLERAGKTFAQAAAGTLTVELAGSGFSAANLPSLAIAEKVGIAAVVAGFAAVLSLVTSVVSGLKTQTASASAKVAETAVTPGAHATDSGTNGPVVVPDVPTELNGLPPLPAMPNGGSTAGLP